MDEDKERLLEKALGIALRAHRGQRDKAGAADIMHPLRVMMQLRDPTERILGLLHDVLEDSQHQEVLEDRFTPESLKMEGIPEDIIDALQLVTKLVNENGEEEEYEAFIRRLQENHLSRRVKMADLQDNMDLTRIESPAPKDFKRLEKYRTAYSHLQEIEKRNPRS